MTRASLDTHQRKQVLDFEMALHQNKAEATEAIREAKAHCGAAIREVESHCVDHAHTIQQSHSNNMQHLEREAKEEEEKDCQSFLATCRLAPRSMRGTNVPSPDANREHVLGHPPDHSPKMPTNREESTTMVTCSTTLAEPMPSLGTKQ